jgi:predicted phosphodiesterase
MTTATLRIAAISDIHGNAPALRAVLADARRRGYDVLAQLGDAFSGPLWPAQTAELLRALPGAIHVLGNHDVALVDPASEPRGESDLFALRELEADTLDWVRGWDRTHALGGDVLLFHGSPDVVGYYLLDEAPHGDARLRPVPDIERDLAGVAARVSVGGHSHLPRTVALSDGRLVINDGSVGLPAFTDGEGASWRRHETGSHHACYALIDVGPDSVSVSLCRVDYDWRRAQAKALAEGRADWAQWLTGRAQGAA